MEQFLLRYRDDWVGIVRNVLGADPLPWQEEFLRKLVDPKVRRISIRAGHGVGKSTGMSWGMICHMLTRYPQKTLCTAPTSGQLFDALFAELKFWINKLPGFLRELFEVTSERVTLRAQPEASFISARTSSKEKPEALSGVHSEHLLLVADEAPGVDEAVFENAVGAMSGDNATTILIGNPTRSSGMFYKTHHELRETWDTMHVSCLDVPLVHEDFVKQVRDTYGEESNAYRVRVLGEFPLADDDTLIPADLVDAAVARDISVDDDAPLVYGLDVARYGDDRSVLCKRRGHVVLELKTWQGLDLMSLVGAVVNEAELDGDPGLEICVDSIGMGAGVADRLRELGYNVRDVNVSETSSFKDKYAKLRDELWCEVREWLSKRACKLPPHEGLRADLVTPKFKFLSNGKIQVEGKPEMKKRIRRSPDHADALCLTFASAAAGVGGRAVAWTRGKALKRGIKRA